MPKKKTIIDGPLNHGLNSNGTEDFLSMVHAEDFMSIIRNVKTLGQEKTIWAAVLFGQSHV